MSDTDERMTAWDARTCIWQHQNQGDFKAAIDVAKKYRPILTVAQLHVIAGAVEKHAEQTRHLDDEGYIALMLVLDPDM